MKKFASVAALLLLLLNAAGALYGGWFLIVDPSGVKLKLSPTVLAHTPFSDFLFPGVVLFSVIGVLSLVVATALLTHMRRSPVLVGLEGCLLTGWIVVQYFWTQVFHPLQPVMAMVGLLLIGCGVFLFRQQKKESFQLRKRLETQYFLFN